MTEFKSQIKSLQQKVEILEEKLTETERQITNNCKGNINTNNGDNNTNTTINGNINYIILRKLNSIKIDNIEPFTEKTVLRFIDDGFYTPDMFYNRIGGIVEFMGEMGILTDNNDSVIEQNYACTGKNGNNINAYRLPESKKWENDRDYRSVQMLLDCLRGKCEEYLDYYIDQESKREISAETVEDMQYFVGGIRNDRNSPKRLKLVKNVMKLASKTFQI